MRLGSSHTFRPRSPKSSHLPWPEFRTWDAGGAGVSRDRVEAGWPCWGAGEKGGENCDGGPTLRPCQCHGLASNAVGPLRDSRAALTISSAAGTAPAGPRLDHRRTRATRAPSGGNSAAGLSRPRPASVAVGRPNTPTTSSRFGSVATSSTQATCGPCAALATWPGPRLRAERARHDPKCGEDGPPRGGRAPSPPPDRC